MQKEIGGYFELEEMSGEEYYPELYKVNLGRTALLWLLKERKYKKIILPYFLCESVVEICQNNHIETEFYHLDENLDILYPKKTLNKNECLYLVNYYGQLTDNKILEYQKIYGNIIVDHTHAFFQRPLEHVDTLYSCRKFWGVSDGAYLATDVLLDMDKPRDRSNKRMGHILGRYEENAGTYYQDMLQNAAQYECMEIRLMSRLTQNLLRGIDYKAGKKKRENNYRVLKEELNSDNIFTEVTPEGPFVYPYYHEKGQELRKWLATRKIFVPTYWRNVMQEQKPDSLEYRWASDILPLPCDQRYGSEEMRYIAASVKEWEATVE